MKNYFAIAFLFFWCFSAVFAASNLSSSADFVLGFSSFEKKQIPSSSQCSGIVALKDREGRGVGYHCGYSTVEGMVFPFSSTHSFSPFLDLRGHWLHSNEFAANGGIGFRYDSNRLKKLFGINGYLDYRSAHDRKVHFVQMGIGIEVLSERWGLWLNGYFPLQEKKTISSCVFDDYTGGFFIKKKKIIGAFTGANIELRSLLKEWEIAKFYGSIGAYYFGENVCDENCFGGKIHAALAFKNYLFVEGNITFDEIFKTGVEGLVKLRIPLGSKEECDSWKRQPIQRFEMIVLDKKCRWKWNY